MLTGRGSQRVGKQWTPHSPAPGIKKTPTKHPNSQDPGSSDDDEYAGHRKTKQKKEDAKPTTTFHNKVQRAKGAKPTATKKRLLVCCM